MIKLFSAMLVAVACTTAALAADDSHNDLLKRVDAAIVLTEASRAARCPLQTEATIRTTCDRAYDMIVGRQKSYKSQLAFMLAVAGISGHSQLKSELTQVRTVSGYNKEVLETTQWILAVEQEFQTDRQIAGR